MNIEPTPGDAPESTNSRATQRIVIGMLAVLVFIAAAAIFVSKTGLDRALVRQQLDAIAAQVKSRGALQGRDVTFTYGDVEIEGSFSNKHAIVRNPQLAIKPLEAEGFEQPEDPKTLLITSERMEIYPEAANLSAMRIEMPSPLKFATIEKPDENLLTVASSKPLAVRYATLKSGGVPMNRWQFNAPESLKLTYLHEQKAEGAEDATPTLVPVYETLNVGMAGEGELSLQQGGSGLGEGVLNLKNIVMAPESQPEAGKVTIAQIVTQWSNQRDDKNLSLVNSSFIIDRIEAAPELLPYAPISANVEVTYEGAMPTSAEEMASITASESAFKLKTFSLTTKDASFNATADFVANPEDRLPVGMANVTVTNLPFIIGELKKHKLLSEDRETLIALLLQQITGSAYTDLKDVAVDVQRTRGGSFRIGQTTFEELFAVLLQASLSKGMPPAKVLAPTVPDEGDKKAQEPIQLPEETRG